MLFRQITISGDSKPEWTSKTTQKYSKTHNKWFWSSCSYGQIEVHTLEHTLEHIPKHTVQYIQDYFKQKIRMLKLMIHGPWIKFSTLIKVRTWHFLRYWNRNSYLQLITDPVLRFRMKSIPYRFPSGQFLSLLYWPKNIRISFIFESEK